MKVRLNDYGHMILTPQQEKLVTDKLQENPCPVCKAKNGESCKTKFMHIGRIPQDWDAVKYLEFL